MSPAAKLIISNLTATTGPAPCAGRTSLDGSLPRIRYGLALIALAHGPGAYAAVRSPGWRDTAIRSASSTTALPSRP